MTQPDHEHARRQQSEVANGGRLPRRWKLWVALALLVVALLGIEQWVRLRTAEGLANIAEDLASVGVGAHSLAWDDYFDLRAEGHTITQRRADDFADRHEAIGDAASTSLERLTRLRVRIEGTFTLPWHQSANRAKQVLAEITTVLEERLSDEIRLLSYPPNPSTTDLVDTGNEVLEGWRATVPRLCGLAEELNDQLAAAIPPVLGLWSRDHDVVRFLRVYTPFGLQPWACG